MSMSRVASLVVVAGYVVAALILAGWDSKVWLLALALVLPLGLIWFPEHFGEYTGPTRGAYINQKSPPTLVAAAGWFFLVGLPIVLYFIWRGKN